MPYTSLDLKAEALAFLRWTKGCPYVATEYGYWAADCFGVNEKHSIEIEVKVSKSDLRAEFGTKSSKSGKHWLYNNCGVPYSRDVPNYFYLLVPPELESTALELLETSKSKAGLLIYDPQSHSARPGDSIRSAKKCVKLHNNPFPENQKIRIVMRMGNEIVARLCAWRIISNESKLYMNNLQQQVLDIVKASVLERNTDGNPENAEED